MGNRPNSEKEAGFPEFSTLEACFPFLDNAQNGYRSVEKTGKIKKRYIFAKLHNHENLKAVNYVFGFLMYVCTSH